MLFQRNEKLQMSTVSLMANGLLSAVLNKDKAVCMICLETVSVLKEYNVKRHFEPCHKSYSMYQGEVEQNCFKKHVEKNLSAVRASYPVAKCIAESGRPFTDGEFKKCMVKR
ncbi:EPM2A-interacting protein 1 [Varanus komodoensis]|nr:EPM2A-interacting protein 1 [Varanus komodoensis]